MHKPAQVQCSILDCYYIALLLYCTVIILHLSEDNHELLVVICSLFHLLLSFHPPLNGRGIPTMIIPDHLIVASFPDPWMESGNKAELCPKQKVFIFCMAEIHTQNWRYMFKLSQKCFVFTVHKTDRSLNSAWLIS